MRDLRSLAEQGTPETIESADGTTTLHRHFVGAVIYAPSAHEAAQRLHLAALYLEAGEILPHDPRVGGERDVYVVRPDDFASDAAVFMREPDAEAFRATYRGSAGDVERCLTANASTAHAMIVERIDDMERDEFVEGYVSAACWADLTGTGEDAESGSDPGAYGTDNLDPLELTAIRDMCSAWIDTNARALALYVEEIPNVPDGTPWERAGHDLWLTRNGHGAGYGDRGVSTGDELAEAARKLGEAPPPMLNDDGTVNMAEDAAATVERIGEHYAPKMRAILERVRDLCREAGLSTDDEPTDMTGDEFKWSIRVWQPEHDQARRDEDLIDVSVTIAEASAYGDDEHVAGLNFALDIVHYGGEIIGGLSPFNYTPKVWVDGRDDDAVSARWQLIADADLSEIPSMIDHYGK